MISRFSLVGLTLFALNCYTAQFGNPSNTYFVNKGVHGMSAVEYNPKDRVGEACVTNIFAMVAFGNASVEAAATRAGITKISSVDHETKFNYFFLQDVCTVVRGQ